MFYFLDLSKRKCEANQFKLVMLGAEGAGKSCTVDFLLGKPFNQDKSSTVSADTRQVVVENNMTVDRVFASNWKPLQTQEQQKEVNTHYEYEKEKAKVLKGKAGANEVQSVPIRIAIYDLGGQEIYYELQFLFLASLDVVFLTFDASKDLDAPVVRRYRFTILQEKYKTRQEQTTLEVIETALQTIHSRCGVKSSNNEVCDYIRTSSSFGCYSCKPMQKSKCHF